jgi:hypothetical protein
MSARCSMYVAVLNMPVSVRFLPAMFTDVSEERTASVFKGDD